MASMKAAAVTGVGDPHVIQLIDVPKPTPPPGHALVRVSAASVNAADLWTRRPGVVDVYPHIPGSDAAGELIESNGASAIAPGAAVVINPAIQSVDTRLDHVRPGGEIVDILGYNTPGTYAEFVVVPISNVYPKPDHLSFLEAAAIPMTFLTAWRMLSSRVALRAGERVLVWGASGGLGCAAISIANFIGARTIAMVGTDSDGQQVRSYGADVTVRYDQPDVVERLRDATQGLGVDVVFDSVAGETWETSLSALRPGGRVALAGTTAGDMITQDLSDIFYYQWTICGSRMGDEREFGEVLRAVSVGQLRPRIGDTFDLASADQAHARMEAGDFVGKLVIAVDPQ